MCKQDLFARVPELEAKAISDYRAVAGKTFLTSIISGYGGYADQPDDSDTFALDKPVVVRVRADMLDHGSSREDVLHWNDEWLDPIWEVDILSGLPGDKAGMYSRFTWVDASRSYNRLTGECADYAAKYDLQPLTRFDRLRLWFKGRRHA